MGIRERISNWVLTTTTLPRETPSFFPINSITTLNDYASLYSIAYLACEQTKARSIGSLPVSVYRRNGDKREAVPGHPLAELLKGRANELMSGQDLLNWTALRRDTFGNAYWWVEWSQGKPVALWPIKAQVKIDYARHAPAGRRTRYIVFEETTFNGTGVTVPAGNYFADEVIHFKTAITKDGIKGESLARLAAEEVGLSVDLERFYKNMLQNGNHQMGHVELPDIKGNNAEKQIESVKRAIEDKCGVGNAGKAPIFGYGAKWVTDQQTMKDASLIEQQQWVLQQVCRATCVPPTKVYDLTNSTYSSAESARIDYATDTIAPEVKGIETAVIPILEAMGQTDHYLKFDLNGLMRGDSQARGQFYREMVYLGAMTRADVREKEDMNPIEGLDKPLVPLNYGILEPDGEITVLSSSATEPADGNQTGTTDKE